MPDEFYRQMNSIKDIIQKSWISAFEIEGYEADDIIGTAAAHGTKERPACVVSSDKDMRQLISDTVSLYDAQKELSRTPWSFFLHYWFLPEHFIDYLGIVGDVADNIPGIRGIGDVGAKKLICKYGSLENIYEHIDEIDGKTRELLLTHRDNAFLSKELATMMEVPGIFPFGVDDCTLPPFFSALEHELLKVWRFNSLAGLLKQIAGNYAVGKQESLFG
jgi:DNA polymerase I